MPNWKLKLDDSGSAVVQDGKPVYVDEVSGDEAALDVNQLHTKIIENGRESKTWREKYEQANTALKPFQDALDGVEDVAEYRRTADAALDTVAKLEGGELASAEKLDRLKTEMSEAYAEKERKLRERHDGEKNEFVDRLAQAEQRIRRHMLSTKFANHPLFGGPNPRTHLPPAAAEATFGRYFSVESRDGTDCLVAKDDTGEMITSKERPGDPADFDEAMEILFSKYPDRDRVLRTSGGGTGAGGGTGGPGHKDDLQVLQEKLKNTTSMRDRIALKRRIHELQMERRGG